MAFSINYVEISLVTHNSMKLVNMYVFLNTLFYYNHYISPKQGSEMYKG